jgi:TFIIF-interacting CTD phosphatase-like protein
MPIYHTSIDEIKGSRPLTDRCIILDLDETCVHTFGEPIDRIAELGLYTNPHLMELRRRVYILDTDDMMDSDKRGQGKKYELWGVMRPGLKEFLMFCFSYFRIVAVWTAGQAKYGEAICDVIFRDIRPPHVIFSYNDCVLLPDVIEKPIQKMIDSDPVLQRYMSLSNTLAIDDRASTFEGPNPDNGIVIPPYQPSPRIDSMLADDIALEQLKRWLMQKYVIATPDVRDLDKTSIFTRPLSQYSV